MRRVSILRSLGIALSLLGSACVHLTMPSVPGGSLVISLPFAASGIRDGRAEFAARFSEEVANGERERSLSQWLHNANSMPIAQPAVFRKSGLSVLVVPGIFGDCLDDQALPFSDGKVRARPRNYTEGYAHFLGELGSVRAIQVRGRASTEVNAKIIAHEVLVEAEKPNVRDILLISYSKGVPDTLVALDALSQEGRLPAKVRGFVSVSGVVMGTPIADQMESLYEDLAAKFAPLDCTESSGGEVVSLTVRERTAWLSTQKLPAGIGLYSVVAYSDRASIAPALTPFYEALSSLDHKNDGQVIAGWMVLPNSKLLAEVKSDHWTYVVAMRRSPSALVREMASSADFPRDAFFRALVKTVVTDLGL